MRLFSVFSVLLFTTMAGNAYAIDAAGWQKQLQGEINAIQKASPYIKAKGEVMVEDVDGGQIRALLPALLMTASDKSTWEIPAIALQTAVTNAASASVKINLPQKFTHMSAASQPLGAVTLGSQNLQGNWNFQQNAFATLNGTLNNVAFSDTATSSQSHAGKIDVNADNAGHVTLKINNIDGETSNGGGSGKTRAENGIVTYTFSGDKELNITRVIGLLNPAILLAENQKLGMETSVERLQFLLPDGKTTSFDKAVLHMQVQPVTKGQTVAIRSQLDVTNMRHTPENAFSSFLPQTGTLLATVSNAPLELLAMAPGQDIAIAKNAMVKAGTRADIDQITIKTPGGVMLKGNGQLKAAANVPTGFVGRVTFKIDDLDQAASAAQRQLIMGGGDRVALTQTTMVLMAVQGLAKKNGDSYDVVVDLTPQGQVFVNGQDISALVGKRDAPAVPIEPVTSTPL